MACSDTTRLQQSSHRHFGTLVSSCWRLLTHGLAHAPITINSTTAGTSRFKNPHHFDTARGRGKKLPPAGATPETEICLPTVHKPESSAGAPLKAASLSTPNTLPAPAPLARRDRQALAQGSAGSTWPCQSSGKAQSLAIQGSPGLGSTAHASQVHKRNEELLALGADPVTTTW